MAGIAAQPRRRIGWCGGQRGKGRHTLTLQRPAVAVKLANAHLAANEVSLQRASGLSVTSAPHAGETVRRRPRFDTRASVLRHPGGPGIRVAGESAACWASTLHQGRLFPQAEGRPGYVSRAA